MATAAALKALGQRASCPVHCSVLSRHDRASRPQLTGPRSSLSRGPDRRMLDLSCLGSYAPHRAVPRRVIEEVRSIPRSIIRSYTLPPAFTWVRGADQTCLSRCLYPSLPPSLSLFLSLPLSQSIPSLHMDLSAFLHQVKRT